jgi:tetratricopeptide (TPR) repeat protein
MDELVGDSLTDIGYVFLIQNRFLEAETCFKRAVEIYSNCLKSKDEDLMIHPKLALCYFHSGNASYMLNRQAEAEKSFMKALEISKAALGNEHPQVKSLTEMIQALLPNRVI